MQPASHPASNSTRGHVVPQGIPPILRTWVWMETSGAASKAAGVVKNYYSNMVAAGQTSPFMKDIETVRALLRACIPAISDH
jgi:hypothetical protein